MEVPFKIAKYIRVGAPTCDVNGHLNYVNETGIDVWNSDPEHVIDVISDVTKPGIDNECNQARLLEYALVDDLINSSISVCCG